MPRTLVDPTPVFTVKGRACGSETRQRTASAYMLEFSTVLTEQGVHVDSVYVAGDRTHSQVEYRGRLRLADSFAQRGASLPTP